MRELDRSEMRPGTTVWLEDNGLAFKDLYLQCSLCIAVGKKRALFNVFPDKANCFLTITSLLSFDIIFFFCSKCNTIIEFETIELCSDSVVNLDFRYNQTV